MQTKYVYLINQVGTDLYKIGFASDVNKRLFSLQSGNPYRLRLVQTWRSHDADKLEKWFHRECRTYRKCREWFQFTSLAMIKLLDIHLKSPELVRKFGAYDLYADD